MELTCGFTHSFIFVNSPAIISPPLRFNLFAPNTQYQPNKSCIITVCFDGIKADRTTEHPFDKQTKIREKRPNLSRLDRASIKFTDLYFNCGYSQWFVLQINVIVPEFLT